ncbi:MAG TPA: lysophospholipid acyltransferase family protein [Polyangiaceae bacterium]|nr:lysophospholipid acyltransferase family protein [Polyangiaceae bacterium]
MPRAKPEGSRDNGKPTAKAAPKSRPARGKPPKRRRGGRKAHSGTKPPPGARGGLAPAEAELRSGLELEMGEAEVASEEVPELGLGTRMVPPNVIFNEGVDSSPPPRSSTGGDVAEQIRALEARLDGMMRGARDLPQAAPEAPKTESVAAPPAEALSDSAYFEQHWGRTGLRNRSEEIDDFGLDPEYEKKTRRLSEFLYKSYFRSKTEGIGNVPADGRCIIVANHSGTLPLDGMMLRTALRLEHPVSRELRWLAEDFLFYLPFAGVFLNRVGAVRACPENAERLLAKESLVAVFPEGVHGIKKLYRERYRLQRFGRGGYIRLALRMRAPLVPCAIVGAEETNPLLYRFESLASVLGLPYIPITPTFPLLGPLGLVPAPTRWRIRFGEPINLDSYGPEAADDSLLVGRLSDRVRSSIQQMLESGLRERRSVWFG